MRHPVNKAAFKAPWSPTRGVGCSTLCLNRVARTHGRFTRRHEPSPGDQGAGGAPYGGYTATEV